MKLVCEKLRLDLWYWDEYNINTKAKEIWKTESKYQKKHFIEMDVTDEMRCHNYNECGNWFTIDLNFVKVITNSYGEDYYEYYCPYCGKKNLLKT